MNTEDIHEQLRDNQEVLTSHSERIGQLEKRETGRASAGKAPDYSSDFAEMRLRLEELAKAATPSKQADELNLIANRVLAKLPGQTKTIVEYRVAGIAKVALVATITCYLLLIISTAVAVHFWRENAGLQQSQDELSLIRQAYPATARWADSSYLHANMTLDRSMSNDTVRKAAGRKSHTARRSRHRKPLL